MNHENGGQANTERADRRCREIISRQMGLISRAQALAAGKSPRQIDTLTKNGAWIAVYTGVYATATSPPTWRRSVLAAVMRGGPQAVASGPCAAALLGLPGFRRPRIEITTPRQLKDPPFVVKRGLVPPDQVARVGPIHVTDATRTLLDLARTVRADTLEDALDDALRRSITSLPRLRWVLRVAGGRGRRGSALLEKLVSQRSDGDAIPESVLETRLWKPLTRLGLPRPVRQHEVEREGRHYRIDFAFPHAMVAVEAQGFRWHSSANQLEKDAEKHNDLAILGWSVIYLTWKDLREGRDDTIGLLSDLLRPRFF